MERLNPVGLTEEQEAAFMNAKVLELQRAEETLANDSLSYKDRREAATYLIGLFGYKCNYAASEELKTRFYRCIEVLNALGDIGLTRYQNGFIHADKADRTDERKDER